MKENGLACFATKSQMHLVISAPLLFKTCLTIRLTSQPTWNVTYYRFSTGSECIITSLQVAENDPNLKFIKPRYACSDLSLTRWCLSKNKHSPLKNSKMNCSCFFLQKNNVMSTQISGSTENNKRLRRHTFVRLLQNLKKMFFVIILIAFVLGDLPFLYLAGSQFEEKGERAGRGPRPSSESGPSGVKCSQSEPPSRGGLLRSSGSPLDIFPMGCNDGHASLLILLELWNKTQREKGC